MLARFYWPAWAAAWAAGWESDRGTAIPKRLREEPVDPDLPSASQVDAIAERLRGPERLTDDHIRHACHVRALGRDKSANDLTPGDADRVVALFRLIADPWDLDAIRNWSEPGIAERRRLLWRIRHHPIGGDYVSSILRDRFGTDNPDSLENHQLRQAIATLAQRQRTRARRTAP